jgi:hypothetical protein
MIFIDPNGMDIYVFDEKTGKYNKNESIEMDFDRLATKSVDKKGNITLKFYDFADPKNDPEKIDAGVITRIEKVSESDIENIIDNSGGFDEENASPVRFARKSIGYGDFDYFTQGLNYYMTSKGRSKDLQKSLYITEGDTYAHNAMNFGNFLWGATAYTLGYSENVALNAADFNSRYNPGRRNNYVGQPDSKDDQLSISRGVKYA